MNWIKYYNFLPYYFPLIKDEYFSFELIFMKISEWQRSHPSGTPVYLQWYTIWWETWSTTVSTVTTAATTSSSTTTIATAAITSRTCKYTQSGNMCYLHTLILISFIFSIFIILQILINQKNLLMFGYFFKILHY